MQAKDIYAEVTERIIAEIESGKANPNGWKKPWQTMVVGHKNVATGKGYGGFNQFWLWIVAEDKGYELPIWGTFKQWKDKGATIKKGEKAIQLIKWIESSKCTTHGDDEMCNRCGKGFPVGFAVFNASQVEGYEYEAPAAPTEVEKITIGEEIVEAAMVSGLKIRHRAGDRAYYEGGKIDQITLPLANQFRTTEDLYSTTFHELSHASGHESRLNREFGKRFGDEQYAMEELVAELGAAFMCAATGIADSAHASHGDYLASWLRVLKSDPKALAHTASKAQAAADHWLKLAAAAKKEQAQAA